MGKPRRLLLAAVVSVLAVLGTAVPASAGRTDTLVTRSSWAYTDQRAPRTPFAGGTGDAPVGSWRDADGASHVSKSYYTFDLGQFRGGQVFAAEVFVAETSAEDCSKPRSTELWRVDPTGKPTWFQAPAERAKQPGPGALD